VLDLFVVPARLGIWLFHLSHRTTVIQDLLVRHQFSLVLDNRTNVNVEAWSLKSRYDEQIYFHWYKTLFDLQFVHNLFWLKLKWNARSKLFLLYHIVFCTKDKFKFGAKFISDNFYVSGPEWFLFLYFKYWYFRSLKHFWDCDFKLLMLSRSGKKDGFHRQFLFLIAWNFLNLLIWS
jgi:hypothetical protein